MPKKLDLCYFDMECLPGHWIGGDYVSKVVTAVAWAHGDEKPTVLTHYDESPGEMAATLAINLEDADVVIGHYIRGFDLRLLNGALLQSLQRPLRPLTTVDTKLDLLKAHGRSLSQENLAASLGLAEPKVKLSLTDWEGFNLKVETYKNKGIERVQGDVIQNRALHRALVHLDWLGPPKTWVPESKGSGYRP